LTAGPTTNNNIIGQDPLFVLPFTLQLQLAGSARDPQMVSVTIVRGTPPTGLPGDYHLQTTSPAIDRGAASIAVAAPRIDIDNQARPAVRVQARRSTPWDLGADELPGVAAPGD
jgi:hypothetical protein